MAMIAPDQADSVLERLGEPRAEAKTAPGVLFTAAGALIISALWALLCNLVLELMWVQAIGHPQQLFVFTLDDRLLLFVCGAGFLWILLVGLTALTGRFWFSAGVLLALSLCFGYANAMKFSQRAEPLYPSDLAFLREARFLLDMVGSVTAGLAAIAVLGIVALTTEIGRRLSGRYTPLSRRGRRAQITVLVVRGAALALTGLVLIQAANFNSTGNFVRSTFEASGARWAWWLQQVNYSRNGSVGAFLYNSAVPAMDEPEGYDRATMKAILDKYTTQAGKINASRSKATPQPNVVIVLGEAFSDITAIDEVRLRDDPIPFTRSLMRRATSGSMLAQLLGGGTANMEFEVLTGMSLGLFEPQMNSPFQMLVPDYPSFPSAAHMLKQQGYDTVAIHPYMKTMYKREVAYPALGFDEFLGEDDVRYTDRIEDNEFVSDASAFREVVRELKSREAPTLVNVVTMQNHYPTDGIYTDPIEVEGLSGRAEELAGGYARGLRHTDDALRDFVAQLERLNEPTAVIFYGDHLPGFWPTGFSDRQGLEAKKTPYFLWSNFRGFTAASERVVSPTHFLPMLFEQLEIPVPPYFALLEDVRSQIPAMEQGIFLDQDGTPVDASDLSDEALGVLQRYRLVQYDMSVGKRYSTEKLWTVP